MMQKIHRINFINIKKDLWLSLNPFLKIDSCSQKGYLYMLSLFLTLIIYFVIPGLFNISPKLLWLQIHFPLPVPVKSFVSQMLSLPLCIIISFASKEPMTIGKVFPKKEEK